MMSTRRNLMDEMLVDVPDGSYGSVSLERFEVTDRSWENMRLAMEPGGRQCLPGTYSRLLRNGTLWMSDTTAERADHMTAALALGGWRPGPNADPARTVLIGGLGLGCILRVALLTETVERVDVVDIDADVIGLVGPHYEKMAADHGIDLQIHHADMYEITWPVGTRWDVAWFDIWPTLCVDNLPEMERLARSYGRRVGWQGFWGKELLRSVQRRDRGGWY